MKIKTSELTSAALDWAVAKAEGRGYELIGIRDDDDPKQFWPRGRRSSTNWSQGGPIIEREKISVIHMEGTQHWVARKFQPACDTTPKLEGPTPLIAAMRCYVASKLGDEVEVPSGLD